MYTMYKVVICLMLTLGPSSKKLKAMSQAQPSDSELGDKGTVHTNIYNNSMVYLGGCFPHWAFAFSGANS